MDIQRVLAPGIRAHLAQRLQEGQRLDIAHRAADFDQHYLGVGGLGNQADAPLNLVGNMRDDLDCAAKIIAAPFLADHFGIHLPGGDIAHAVQSNIDKTLVMA